MEKIKQFVEGEKGKNIMIVFIIVLIGSASFELGRLYHKGTQTSGVKIEYPAQSAIQPESVINTTPTTKNYISTNVVTPQNTKNLASSTNSFFASKRGHKYYPVGCSAGKAIKKENRVYFATREEATKAGYTLSSSCR